MWGAGCCRDILLAGHTGPCTNRKRVTSSFFIPLRRVACDFAPRDGVRGVEELHAERKLGEALGDEHAIGPQYRA